MPSAEGRLRARARALVRDLSAREGQVLHGLVDGLTNKDIARLLDISPRTVEIHRANMLRRLGVKTSLEAACIGVLAGFGERKYLRMRA